MRQLLLKSISLVPWGLRAWIKHIPLLASLQRGLLGAVVEGHEFIHTVDAGPARGLRYPITLPDDKGIWTGTYELELATRIAAAVRPGAVCLDVGGWRGFFAGVMALAGASKVVVFEPLPTNAAQIRRMMQLNPRLPIELYEFAIADTIGATQFQVMAEASMAKMSDSTFQPQQRGQKSISVVVETLDHLRSSGVFQRADLIKLDVEGAEFRALKGAEEILRQDRPAVFIEIHSRGLASECLGLLSSARYSVTTLETGGSANPEHDPEVCHFVARPS